MRLAQLAMLIAIQAILTFTPLGFIMIPPISITIMHIPVIIGAVTMGPLFGGILGASFGVMSMLKATFAAASPADIIFSPFISGTPVQSLILCVVPRILLGVIEQLSKTYISTLWADAIVFGVLVAVLVVKPTGLLGKRISEKV